MPKLGTKSDIRSRKQLQIRKIEERSNFVPPECGLHTSSGCLFLFFRHSFQITLALGRAHVFYEGRRLRGPLKGVNMPISTWLAWWRGTKDGDEPLTAPELFVRDILSNLSGSGDWSSQPPSSDWADSSLMNTKVSYLIALVENDYSSSLHEWSHARFYLDREVREEAHSIFDCLAESVRTGITQELEMRGYRKDVLVDEFLAYLVETPGEFGNRFRPHLEPLYLRARKLIHPVPLAELTIVHASTSSCETRLRSRSKPAVQGSHAESY